MPQGFNDDLAREIHKRSREIAKGCPDVSKTPYALIRVGEDDWGVIEVLFNSELMVDLANVTTYQPIAQGTVGECKEMLKSLVIKYLEEAAKGGKK